MSASVFHRVLLALLLLGPSGCHAAPLSITRRSVTNLPTEGVDQFGTSFTIAGLSGITYLDPARAGLPDLPPGGDHRFIAVMDNSDKVLELSLRFDATGSITHCSLVRSLTLAAAHDWEGIAFTDSARGTILLSDEDRPALSEFRLGDGYLLRDIPAPAIYSQRRANFGLESLTSRERTDHCWIANEEALASDGNISTQNGGTDVRLSLLNIPASQFAPPTLLRQVVYRTESLHGAVISGSRSGISDLLALPDGRLLALERSFAFANPLFLTRIYEVDAAPATDVRTQTAGLVPGTFTRCAKSLLYSGGNNNLEGLCLGPRLGDNTSSRWVLLGIVDDGDPLSINQVVSFSLDGLIVRRRVISTAPAQ